MSKITPLSYHLAVVLKSLHFPISYPSVNDSLKKRGYTLSPLPSLPIGARSYISGRIASKEECYVDIDADRKIIACEGRDAKKVIETIKDLVNMATEDFSVNSEDFDYCELIANFNVTTTKHPIESIKKTLKNEFYTQISKVLKHEVSPFMVTFVPSDRLPSDKIWFDIRVTPDITMPKDVYSVSVVYRHEDKNDVLAFTNEVDSKILELINLIEV